MKTLSKITDLIKHLGIKAGSGKKDFFIYKLEEAKPKSEFKADFFQIFVITEDVNSVQPEQDLFTDLSNTICFAAPGVQPRFNLFDERITGYGIAFTPAFTGFNMQDYELITLYPFFTLNSCPHFKLSGREKDYLPSILSQLLLEKGNKDLDQEIQLAYLSIVLNSCVRMLSDNIEAIFINNSEEITNLFEDLLISSNDYTYSNSEAAQELNIQPAQLKQALEEIAGKTIKDINNEYKLVEAKYQLSTTDDSIEEISTQFGYADGGSFSKFFKKYAGVSPREFRRELLMK